MKTMSRYTLAAALALSLPMLATAQSATVAAAAASAPGARAAGAAIVVRARIVELDKVGRVVTLKGPKGNIVTVAIPPEVKNLDKVNVGDNVVIRYLTGMAVKLEPTANKSGIRERIESTQDMKAPAGGMPGIAEVRTVEVLAIVQSIDRKAKQATLRGAKRIITIDVPDNIDLSKVKVGDEVRAVFTEAAVVSVEPAAKKP
jgi:hypothetical protein